MTDDQLREMVNKLRTMANSAPTLSAKLASDSEKIKPKNPVAAKRKAILEGL